REAEAPPEDEADDELEREQRDEPVPAREHSDEGEDADRRLVEPRRARVDHSRFAVRVREPFHQARYASISTLATSGRENSTGGNWPAASSSRTFVPLRKTWSWEGCGHVFALAIDPHVRHQNECSKNIGSMSSSCGLNSSKISCASYEP